MLSRTLLAATICGTALLTGALILAAVFIGDWWFERIRRRHERPWRCPVCGDETHNPGGHRCGAGE